MDSQHVADETVNALIELGRQLRDQVNLFRIQVQLKSSDLDDRLDSALFAMSHLFYSGAVAENQIENAISYQKLPKAITKRDAFTYYDEIATLRAWEGASFDYTRNIIGSLAFLVAALFFFESFTKLVIKRLGKEPPYNAGKLVAWLDDNTTISSESLGAISFLNHYRNAWHALGVYEGKSPVRWGTLTLTPGAHIPTPTRIQSMDLLGELVAVVLAVNRLRP